MIISFDMWGTLIKGNGAFKEKKYDLLRNMTAYTSVKGQSAEEMERGIKIVKRFNDDLIEIYGTQPDQPHLFAQLASWFKIPANNFVEFFHEYQKLFILNPPLLWSDDTLPTLQKLKAEGHVLNVSSNTLFTDPDSMTQIMHKIGLMDVISDCLFSGDMQASKPHAEMFFHDAHYHVGDNALTDGASVRYGVPFYQINSNDKTIVDFHNDININGNDININVCNQD